MADVDALHAAAERVCDGWYPAGPIDWVDFLDRIEDCGFDLGDSMMSPEISAIKKHVRKYRSQG